MTNDIKVVIEELLFYAGKNLDMYEEDYILRRNNLLDLLKVDAPADAPVDNCRPLQEILDDVNEYAAENHLAEEWEKINFETRVMGLLMPMPFQVITTFEQLAASDPALATKYLYNLSVNSNYIRKVDIDKNIGWKVANPRGDIMITGKSPESHSRREKRAADRISQMYALQGMRRVFGQRRTPCPSDSSYDSDYPQQRGVAFPVFAIRIF